MRHMVDAELKASEAGGGGWGGGGGLTEACTSGRMNLIDLAMDERYVHFSDSL